jgi:hypothetical protein
VQETHYPYIPLDYGMFFRLLGCLEKVGKFIDVGCGIGDKVLTANLVFGAEAEGIEYTPQTYYIGKYYLDKLGKYPVTHWDSKPPETKLIFGDAFDHDFKKYDTIYLYHPICDEQLMHKLYLHIFKTMKNGAVMIEAMTGQSLQDAVEIHNDWKRKKSHAWHAEHFTKVRGKIKPLKEVKE